MDNAANMQCLWSGLIRATGGASALDKSHWLEWLYKKIQDSPAKLEVADHAGVIYQLE